MALSDKLKTLKAAGFDVPDNAVTFAEDSEYNDAEKVLSVWKCGCGHIYRSSIALSFYDHGCGKSAKKRWPRL